MKPHPRIRKTVKWGGAALTMLFVVLYIASRLWVVEWRREPFGDDFAFGWGGVRYSRGLSRYVGLPQGWRVSYRPTPSRFYLQWGPWNEGYLVQWGLPLSIPVIVTLVPTAIAWRLDALARRRDTTRCPRCRYDRSGLAAGALCPECGAGAPGGAAQR